MYEHLCEFIPITGNVADDCARLCQLLDQRSLAGAECVSVLPVQFQTPNLSNNGVLQATRQPAFAVLMRQLKTKEVVNGQGQAVLDDRAG
jgi:hypothetical protein